MSSSITGRTRIAGVIGWPIEHSLSPTLHNAGFASLGLDWIYCAFPTPTDRIGAAIAGARALGIGGLSVTMPHKTAAVELVDSLTDSARLLDSVNTIEFVNDGSLRGHSTDGDGLMDSLADAGVDVVGRTALVLGFGGAGRAVWDALARSGCDRVLVTNRSEISSARLERIGLRRDDVVDWALRDDAAASADIVVNATSLGMGSSTESPVSSNRWTSSHVAVDLVYHPSLTVFLDQARLSGANVVGGLGMLVHQAARQQEIWTGRRPDADAMKRAASDALRALA